MAPVCVTGGSGFLASWLIKLLLERGYTVRATIRDSGNLEKTAHLRNLLNAKEKLELVTADLLDNGSFDAVVDGCDVVFHTASPVVIMTENPEVDLINPAVKGTLNVLNACAKANSVKRIVLTSSMAAVSQTPAIQQGTVIDESVWSDPEYCRKTNRWYQLSKVLAEMEAWTFAKERGLDLVVINPGVIVGRPLQTSMDIGSENILNFLTGGPAYFRYSSLGWVDVKDVAEAHILAYEVPTASGRYICVERKVPYAEMMEILQKLCPNYPIPKESGNEAAQQQGIAYEVIVSTRKLQTLGLACKPIEHAVKECVDWLIERNLLKLEA